MLWLARCKFKTQLTFAYSLQFRGRSCPSSHMGGSILCFKCILPLPYSWRDPPVVREKKHIPKTKYIFYFSPHMGCELLYKIHDRAMDGAMVGLRGATAPPFFLKYIIIYMGTMGVMA